MIYLDNAATSHPKPEGVYRAADAALRAGGNPGRGGHRLALAAGRQVMGARDSIARLFGMGESSRVLFTGSATDSLNLALKGLLRPGDHVITTRAEHNALRRPLAVLEQSGVQVTWLPVSPEGFLDPASVAGAMRPNTRLIAIHHGSNVTGAVQPVASVADIARRHGALLLVDAAQTAGVLPIRLEQMGIHLLAAPGHKGLLGPQGTGILLVSPEVDLVPVKEGGTGSFSAAMEQPRTFPEGFESGTLNLPGVAGLAAGVEYLLEHGLPGAHERRLTAALAEGLREIPGLTVYGPKDDLTRSAVVTFSIAGLDPGDVEERLDDEFGVLGRAGLHCNPGAHEVIGSHRLGGAMRLSPGWATTEQEITEAVRAVQALAGSGR